MRPRVSVRGSVGSILLDLHRRTSRSARACRTVGGVAAATSQPHHAWGGYSIFSEGDQSLCSAAPQGCNVLPRFTFEICIFGISGCQLSH